MSEKFELTFGVQEYVFQIFEKEGVIVLGCDCHANMTDDDAEKVYWALDAYLISKGKISERWG